MRKLVFYLLLTVLFFQSPALAQTQDEGTTLRIGTELLQIDAVVTDKNGRIVENLTKDDFELLEEGTSQEISFFSVVRALSRDEKAVTNSAIVKPSETSSLPNISIPENARRTIVLVIDDLHISPGNMVGVKKQLLNFIRDQVEEGDRVAVVSTGGGLGYLQQLTADRRVMKIAVERLKPQERRATSPIDPTRLTEFQAQQVLLNDQEALNLAIDNYTRNTGADPEAAERAVLATARQIVSNLSAVTSATLNTVRNAIQSLKVVPGRKTILLVTDGFLLEFKEANHNNEIQRVIDAATRSGVAIYSLSSAGLVALDPTGRDISESSFDKSGVSLRISSQGLNAGLDGMKLLAEETGGIAIYNTNDIRTGFQRLVSDNELYYVLAFYPEKSRQDGKFHKISIRLKNRKDLVVRTRKGYFAADEKNDAKIATKKEKSKDKEKEVSPEAEGLQNALYSILPLDAIPVKLTGSFFGKSAGSEDNTVISLAINLRNIKFEKASDRHRNNLRTSLVVISEDGKIVRSVDDHVELKFTEQNFEAASKGWFFFGKTILLKPGLYNLRFAVRDPLAETLGSASQWIEIPDLTNSKLALSSILLLRDDTMEGRDAGITAAGQASPSASGVLALRQFQKKASLGFVSYIFNTPGLDKGDQTKYELVTQIQIFRDDVPVFTSPLREVKEHPDNFKRIPCGAKLPLAGFTPGRYVLKLTAIERKSGMQASQEQDFTVE